MILDCTLKLCKQRRRGYSLLEFAIVLGVMGIVLGALWSVVSIVRERHKRGEMEEQMVAMVTNIRSFYLGRANVATPMNVQTAPEVTDYLLKQGVLLVEQIRDRTAGQWVADHPWGITGASGGVLANGGIAVSGLLIGGVGGLEGFDVQLRGLKFDTCVELASRLSGANPPGLREVHINGGATLALVTPDAAVAQCQRVPAGDQNTLDFVYLLRMQ